jgi:tetratricopeptide (TPR) repeat protein
MCLSLGLRLGLVLVAVLACGCGARRDLYGQQVKKVNDYSLQGEERFQQGDLKRADRDFSRALELSRAVDYPPGVAQQLNNLGAVALEQGDLNKARHLFTQAWHLNQDLGNWADAATNQTNLATVAQKAGDLGQAAQHLTAAQDAAQKSKAKAALGQVLCRWGSFYLDQQNYGAALDFLKQAQSLATTPALKGNLYHQWGRLYLAQGDAPTAAANFAQALAADRQVLDRAAMAADLFALGETHQVGGDFSRAFYYYGRAFDVYAALGKKSPLKECVKRLKEVNDQGQLGQSLERFEKHPKLGSP